MQAAFWQMPVWRLRETQLVLSLERSFLKLTEIIGLQIVLEKYQSYPVQSYLKKQGLQLSKSVQVSSQPSVSNMIKAK